MLALSQFPSLALNNSLYPTHTQSLVYSELKSTGLFEEMSQTTDEEEHSIEMHLPYVAKVTSHMTLI